MNFRYVILFYSLSFCFGLEAQEIRIKKLDINSNRSDEFAPSDYKDGILFVSNKKSNAVETVVELDDKGKETYLEKLYYAKYKKNDSTKFSVEPLQIVETEKKEGPGAYSKTEDLVIFTQNVTSESRKERDKLALFQIQQTNGVWSTPKLLPFVNLANNYSHPCISEDGNRLLFVSDMAEGNGKMDIWESKKQDSIWQQPTNLGSVVNSIENDVFPSYGDGTTIYFSSKRADGFGEYDIYSFDASTGALRILEEPINSSSNDFSYLTSGNNTGYFSSNRGGTDDIYHFSKTFNFPDSCIASYKPKMCFTFYDQKPISDTIPYNYKWYFGDGAEGVGNYANHCFATEGEYEVVLSLVDSITGFEIKKVDNYLLSVKKYLPYYLSITQEKEQVHLVLKDSKTDDNVMKSMIWQVNNEPILFNKEKVDITKQQLGLGYHSVKVTGIDDSSTCYTDVFFNDYSVPQKENKIKLVPNTQKIDSYIGLELSEYIKNKLSETEIKRATITQPTNLLPSTLTWLEKFQNQFSLEYGLAISTIIDAKSSDLYLSLQ